MARNWFPEERRRQAEFARRDRPWEQSTGPKNPEGKARASLNALRHGFDSAAMIELRGLMRQQRDFIASLNLHDPVE